MISYVSLGLDIIILAALGATIFFCLRLSQQFNQMRADRKSFETLVQAINVATSKAEASVRAFKEMAAGGGDVLQEKINKAKALSEELEIMIQAADSLADRLQAVAEKSRKTVQAVDMTANEQEEPRTRAEKELMDALRAQQKQ